MLGQELCEASKQQMVALRQNIGYIFQAHNLLKFLTAKQNVQMALELHDLSAAAANARAEAMLAAVDWRNDRTTTRKPVGRAKTASGDRPCPC